MSEQENQPQGIVGEIVEGIHSLEQKVEHLIHPQGEAGNAQAAATASSLPTSSTSSAPPSQETSTNTVGASSPDTSDASTAGTAAISGGELPNDQASPTTGSPAGQDAETTTTHEFYLTRIIAVIERDFNVVPGELSQLIASAKQHL